MVYFLIADVVYTLWKKITIGNTITTSHNDKGFVMEDKAIPIDVWILTSKDNITFDEPIICREFGDKLQWMDSHSEIVTRPNLEFWKIMKNEN